jgi:hypothetical protein
MLIGICEASQSLGDGFAPGFGRLGSISSRCVFARAALFRGAELIP